MSDAEVRAARSNEALARRLMRRYEDVPLAAGDLVRVSPGLMGHWVCGSHEHYDPFNVEIVQMSTTIANCWWARCLKHEVEADLLLPNQSRTFEFL